MLHLNYMGIKDKRTKILLALMFLGGEELTPVSLDKKIQELFDIPFNQKTRGTISSLIKEGVISKEEKEEGEKKETGVYRLTDFGFNQLCLRFPFFRFVRGDWDGYWRIISYEIPEKMRYLRDRLRREMAGWGLGPWHRSFWLTPHPIMANLKKLVANQEEEQYIQAFEAKHSLGKREILLEKVWGKTSLERYYRRLFKEWYTVLSEKIDKKTKFMRVISAYVEILKNDPGLPKELMGEKWIGFESWGLFKEIKSILLN